MKTLIALLLVATPAFVFAEEPPRARREPVAVVEAPVASPLRQIQTVQFLAEGSNEDSKTVINVEVAAEKDSVEGEAESVLNDVYHTLLAHYNKEQINVTTLP